MKLIDITVISFIICMAYYAIRTYFKQGSCGCGKKNCANKKRSVTKKS